MISQTKTRDNSLRGPLFVVGMPRSGTKLLRDLLNRHPSIGIPVCETHFIPYFVRLFGEAPDFSTDAQKRRLTDALAETNFIWDLQAAGYPFDADSFIQEADFTSWNTIFCDLFAALAPNHPNRESMFWVGDKTPGYLLHMPFLKGLFPDARFIHIVRDPRDYCLSVHKAWGKSQQRAAHRWHSYVEQAISSEQSLGSDCIRISYEDLIGQTRETLSRLCDFLNLTFQPEMLELKQPTENLGDTKGSRRVESGNTAKFSKRMSDKQLRKIEEIVLPTMRRCGYTPVIATKHIPLSPTVLSALRWYDGVQILLFQLRENEPLKGIKYFLNTQKLGSWR